MTISQDTPSPHQVWLAVSYVGLTPEVARNVSVQLRGLQGWHSTLTGEGRAAFRYAYRKGEKDRIVRQARSILNRAGIAIPILRAFDIWNVEYALRSSLSPEEYRSLNVAINSYAAVLDTRGNDSRTVLIVEFQGEPSKELLGAIRTHVAQFAA